MNSYYNIIYGGFRKPVIKEQNNTKYSQAEVNRITKEWNESVNRLKNSGVDLSKIRISKEVGNDSDDSDGHD